MTECLQLTGDRLDDGRMTVAERVDGDPSEQVEVLTPVGVDDHRADPCVSARPGVP